MNRSQSWYDNGLDPCEQSTFPFQKSDRYDDGTMTVRYRSRVNVAIVAGDSNKNNTPIYNTLVAGKYNCLLWKLIEQILKCSRIREVLSTPLRVKSRFHKWVMFTEYHIQKKQQNKLLIV